MKLNLGCGPHTPHGWLNVDYSLGASMSKIPGFRGLNRRLRIFDLSWNSAIMLHDLRTRFPWHDGTADLVYSSHTLEHFSKEEGRFFLAECHRVLKPNGTLRIVVPDLAAVVREYSSGRLLADDFVASLGVLYGTHKNSLKRKLYPLFTYPHKCMYDKPRLLQILLDLGFNASLRHPFDSAIKDIAGIELPDRTIDAVIVEGTKKPIDG